MPIKLGQMTLYSVRELSRKFDVTSVTIRSYLKQERIKGQKLGGTWYVSESSLRMFFEGRPDTRERGGKRGIEK